MTVEAVPTALVILILICFAVVLVVAGDDDAMDGYD